MHNICCLKRKKENERMIKEIKPCLLNDKLGEWFDIYKNYEGMNKEYLEAKNELYNY